MADNDKRISALSEEEALLQRRISLMTEYEQKKLAQIELEKMAIKIAEEEIATAQASAQEMIKQIELENELYGTTQKRLNALKNQEKQLRDTIRQQRQIIDNAKDFIRELEEQTEALRQVARATSQTITALTGVSDAWKQTLVGSIAFSSSLNGLGNTLGTVASQMKEQLSLSNLLGSSMMKLQEATLYLAKTEYDSLVLFNRATGATGQFDDQILSLSRSTQSLGVTVEDTAAAYQNLIMEFGPFTSLSREQQDNIARTNTLLARYGVNATTSAKAMESLWRLNDRNIGKATDQMMELVGAAEELSIGADRMMNEFAQSTPILAHWGSVAVEKFVEVQAAFKATGIEASRLIAITNQFNTFDGAAQAAGRLNAVLGGPLVNAMDLLNASESERIRMLIQSVEMSGRSWEEMGRFERRSVAAAAGITDMNEAQLLFNTSLSAYDAQQRSIEGSFFFNPEKLEERSRQYQTLQESLKALFLTFAVGIQPILDVVMWLVKGLSQISDVVPGVLVWVLLLVKVLKTGLAVSLMKIVTIIPRLIFGTKVAGIGLGFFGKSAGAAAPHVASLGVSMVILGGGIALVGLGIALAVGSLALLFAVVVDNIDEFGAFVGYMVGLAGAMALFGLAAPATFLGLSALSIGLGLLATSLFFIKTKDLEALSTMFQAITEISSTTAMNLRNVAASIREVTSAASDIDFPTAVRFSAFVDGIGELAPALAQITPETPRLTREIVDQVDRYYSVRAEAGELPKDEFAALATSLQNIGTGGSRPQTVVVNLDGREITRFILDTVNDHTNLSVAV